MCSFIRCDCHALGSTNGQCDIHSGQCECQPGITGQHCERCEVNHFGFGPEGCKRKGRGWHRRLQSPLIPVRTVNPKRFTSLLVGPQLTVRAIPKSSEMLYRNMIHF